MTTLNRSVGYQYLRQKYKIQGPPHFRQTLVSEKFKHLVNRDGAIEEHILPMQYYPGDTDFDHIEFALKYEGLDLVFFTDLFEKLSELDIQRMIEKVPTGQYARKLWFIYERITSKKLPIADLKIGNYVRFADPELYFTIPPLKIARYRIDLNIPFVETFCPLIRRTEKILAFQKENLSELVKRTIKAYPPELLARAVSYLYMKETKASFLIEKEEPDNNRAEKFIYLLQRAEQKNFLNKSSLIELQNAIVDSRFAVQDYRDFQNYVGESHGFGQEKIHFICPKPADVDSLMNQLISVANILHGTEYDPVLIAAIISFGFVFIHPFDDGNGRIHRFLMHNILSLSGFAPAGMIFPISATILQQIRTYDQTLESFSNPLLALIRHKINDNGEMTVIGETRKFYSYIDFTSVSEKFYAFVHDTITKQLPRELDYLTNYDAAKKAIRAIVDMPDRLIDLFIRVCRENKGTLSKSKRQSHFQKITDEEIDRMEKAYAATVERDDEFL